jgi:hypothetical protein
VTVRPVQLPIAVALPGDGFAHLLIEELDQSPASGWCWATRFAAAGKATGSWWLRPHFFAETEDYV